MTAKEIEDTRKAASKKRDEDKASVIEKLRSFLHANKAPMMDKAALADWLMAAALPPAWEKRKLKTKNGKHRADPAIIIDGEGLKFSRFLASCQTKNLSLRARPEEKSLDLGRVGR